jgi:hypothetical protein
MIQPGGLLVRTHPSATPCFLGANPASSPLLGGAVLRPLAQVEELARDLVRSLSPELSTRAVLLPDAPSDLLTGNRTRVQEAVGSGHPTVGYSETPKGVPATALDRGQREMLRSLVDTYLGRAPEAVSPTGRYAEDAVLDAVHFALGRAYRARRPALLPAPGPAATPRVGQHSKPGEPRALGVAGPDGGLRAGRARRTPGRAPLTPVRPIGTRWLPHARDRVGRG